MAAATLPPLTVLPIVDIGATHPNGRLWPEGPDTRRPCWWVVGGHHNAGRLVATRLGRCTDPKRPPTAEDLVRLGAWRPCGCKTCRRIVAVWAWWGGQAVEIARRRRPVGVAS